MGKIEIERNYDDNGNLISKQCSKCKKVKDVSEFYKCKSKSDGLQSYCKDCRKEHDKIDKRKDYMKEYSKKYLKTDKGKDYRKKHYEINKEIILNKQKKRRQTPEGKAVQKRAIHKRRAKKKGNGGKYTADGWNQCLDYFNHCDAYTGEPLESTEIEHVIPISKGGTTYIYNLVPANRSTNRSKHNSDVFEWYSKQEYFSWDRYIKICMWVIKNGGASKDINIKE